MSAPGSEPRPRRVVRAGEEPLAPVLVGHRADVLWVTWNRPESLNALTTAMLDRAASAITEHHHRSRLIVLSGVGRAFSSGAAVEPGNAVPGTLAAAHRLVRSIVNAEPPVLVALNGLAAGVAISVALSGDIVLAKSSAYLEPAFVRVGLAPDGGATELIAASLGRARATRMLMLGERVSAEAARESGLITHVADDAQFEIERDRLIELLSTGPTQAYRELKCLIRAASLPQFERTLAAESVAQRRLLSSTDVAEGIAAFQARRAPVFRGI